MNKKTKIIMISIIVMILICLIYMAFIDKKREENKTDYSNINQTINENKSVEQETKNQMPEQQLNEEQKKESIEEIKKETGLKAETNLYEINTEYDGRKVLNIKASIQYKVAFAGIIKHQMPKMDEVEKIFSDSHPTKSGIWIEEQSRSKVLQLLKANTKSEYNVDKDGFLMIENSQNQNNYDKKLEELINNKEEIIILAISSLYYEVDNVTGEIVEYPFEKLDNYKTYDKIESEKKSIIFITTNSEGKLTDKQILNEILQMKSNGDE